MINSIYRVESFFICIFFLNMINGMKHSDLIDVQALRFFFLTFNIFTKI